MNIRRFAPPAAFALGMFFIAQYGAFALFLCSLLLVYFVQSEIRRSHRDAREAINQSESTYSFGGAHFRVFIDANDEHWFRSSDFKKHLNHTKTDQQLQQIYPSGFARVNPQINVWYIHTDSIRHMYGKSTRQPVGRFLAWLENDVIGKHRFQPMDPVKERYSVIPEPVLKTTGLKKLIPDVMKIWRGEAGMWEAAWGGGLYVILFTLTLTTFNTSSDWSSHYQIAAFKECVNLVLTSFALYVWGKALLLSTERWLGAGRSIVPAIGVYLIGFLIVIFALRPFITTENQYSLSDLLGILTDRDVGATVVYDGKTKYITLDGDLGFGTSNRLRDVIEANPQALSISLNSYGGRAEEGFAINRLIEKAHLNTNVYGVCMSACIPAFAGGQERYVAVGAHFGIHRSGQHWLADDGSMSEYDNKLVDLLRDKHVSDDLIKKGMIPSIHEIYEPATDEVIASRLGTVLYDPDTMEQTRMASYAVATRLEGVFTQMIARLEAQHVPYSHGTVQYRLDLDQATDYVLNDDGTCDIKIDDGFIQKTTLDELSFAAAVEMAHCYYKDSHTIKTEHEAWSKVYRADSYAVRLYGSDALIQSCRKNADSADSPSCDHRKDAVIGGREYYRN